MTFRVELGVYNGPIDLLLYLARRQEVSLMDVSLSKVIEQYSEYLELLQELFDFVQGRDFPELDAKDPERVSKLFNNVCRRTAVMVSPLAAPSWCWPRRAWRTRRASSRLWSRRGGGGRAALDQHGGAGAPLLSDEESRL